MELLHTCAMLLLSTGNGQPSIRQKAIKAAKVIDTTGELADPHSSQGRQSCRAVHVLWFVCPCVSHQTLECLLVPL